MKWLLQIGVLVGILAIGLAGSLAPRAGNGLSYNPIVDPKAFVTAVSNPYFPLVPGTVLNYKQTDFKGTNAVQVTVLSETKTILGVRCVVVHDTVKTVDGSLLEDTYDWYAQDKVGNVWYFGEATESYTGGAVTSTHGSWEAGVGGAKPGIIMEAAPKVGDSYRQEYFAGVAEDKADVLSQSEQAVVPYGTFAHCVLTKDYTDLEPGAVEHKYFASGIGPVLVVVVEGGSEREELTSVTK